MLSLEMHCDKLYKIYTILFIVKYYDGKNKIQKIQK